MVDEQNAHTEEQRDLQSPAELKENESEDDNKDNEKDEDTKELESPPCMSLHLYSNRYIAYVCMGVCCNG